MKYLISLNDKQYEVIVEHHKANISNVTPMTATVPQQSTTPAPIQNTKQENNKTPIALPVNGTTVTAPLPGTITQVKVSQGQKIKRGDLLCMLEAMKMENEIAAPVDGIVVNVVTGQGSAVQTGDILIVIG